MRKITLFAVAAAALVAIGLGLWAAGTNAHIPGTSRAALIATGFGPTNAGVPETSQGIDPFQIHMTSGKGLHTEHFVDYTFVYVD